MALRKSAVRVRLAPCIRKQPKKLDKLTARLANLLLTGPFGKSLAASGQRTPNFESKEGQGSARIREDLRRRFHPQGDFKQISRARKPLTEKKQ